MLVQIVNFILDVITGMVGGACLLRLVMQWQRVPFNNPVGRFIFAITDWVVMPLRRIIPALGRLDSSSLMAAWLLKMSHILVMWLIMGSEGALWGLPLAGVLGVLQWMVSGLSALVLLYAVLSWVQPNSINMAWLARMVEPWLAPLRRALPALGGVDLSPLALLLLLQIAGMLLSSLRFS